MAARDLFSSQTTSESTCSTAGSPTTQETLTVTAGNQTASTDYWLFFSALLTSASTSLMSNVYFKDGSTTIGQGAYECKDTVDYAQWFHFEKYTSAGTPVDKTWTIQHDPEATGTSKAKNSKIALLKAHSSDQYTENDSAQTLSASYANKLTLTFTPATSGDYLIIAQAYSGDNDAFWCKLNVNSTDYAERQVIGKDTDDRLWWGTMLKATLAASSQSIHISCKNDSTTATVKYLRILAIRLDTLEAQYYSDSLAEQSYATDSNYSNALTVTQTPNPAKHIYFGTSITHTRNTANQSTAKFAKGATAYSESIREAVGTNTLDGWNVLDFFVETPSASSTSWTIDHKRSAGTTYCRHAAIALLQTEAYTPPPPSSSGMGCLMAA